MNKTIKTGVIIISVLILATYSNLELNLAENRGDPTKIINFPTSNEDNQMILSITDASTISDWYSKIFLVKAISFKLLPDESCQAGFSLQPFGDS